MTYATKEMPQSTFLTDSKILRLSYLNPPEIQLNTDRRRAEVRNHYRIQGFVADGSSLEGGFIRAGSQKGIMFLPLS